MHNLLDALIQLCNALLIPFTQGTQGKPTQNKWLIVIGSLIAIIGMIAVGGAIVLAIQRFMSQ